MCTKNIGLTGARLARRVAIALTEKKETTAEYGGVGAMLRLWRGSSLGQRAMRSGEWKTYRTRFLVKAKQLSSSLSFVDELGREQSGRRGDYLVESSEGMISIAPQKIFEDIYVPMLDERASDRPGLRKQPQAWRERRGESSMSAL